MRDLIFTRDQVLRAIHDLQRQSSAGIARTSSLAQRLGVKGSSVTARVQELARAELVHYVPRQGASLSEEGEQLAVAAIAKIRLLERFLTEVLKLPGEWVAEESEHMARYISERVLRSIQRFCDGRVGTPRAPADR